MDKFTADNPKELFLNQTDTPVHLWNMEPQEIRLKVEIDLSKSAIEEMKDNAIDILSQVWGEYFWDEGVQNALDLGIYAIQKLDIVSEVVQMYQVKNDPELKLVNGQWVIDLKNKGEEK